MSCFVAFCPFFNVSFCAFLCAIFFLAFAVSLLLFATLFSFEKPFFVMVCKLFA